jgi:hypothetical protein
MERGLKVIWSLMCNAIKWSFAAAYLLLLAINISGLLSADRDYLSGLLLIGLPWTLFLDSYGMIDFYSGVSPTALTVLAPMINLAILFSICSTLHRRRTFSKD